MIYADYAATTPLDKKVLEKMMPYFSENYGNPSSMHAFGREASSEVENARGEIAKIINARKNEIYFTSGGTESDNWALTSVLNSEKNHIITTSIEHHAIINQCKNLHKNGVEVTFVEADENGIISTEKIKNSIKSNTALI